MAHRFGEEELGFYEQEQHGRGHEGDREGVQTHLKCYLTVNVSSPSLHSTPEWQTIPNETSLFQSHTHAFAPHRSHTCLIDLSLYLHLFGWKQQALRSGVASIFFTMETHAAARLPPGRFTKRKKAARRMVLQCASRWSPPRLREWGILHCGLHALGLALPAREACLICLNAVMVILPVSLCQRSLNVTSLSHEPGHSSVKPRKIWIGLGSPPPCLLLTVIIS